MQTVCAREGCTPGRLTDSTGRCSFGVRAPLAKPARKGPRRSPSLFAPEGRLPARGESLRPPPNVELPPSLSADTPVIQPSCEMHTPQWPPYVQKQLRQVYNTDTSRSTYYNLAHDVHVSLLCNQWRKNTPSLQRILPVETPPQSPCLSRRHRHLLPFVPDLKATRTAQKPSTSCLNNRKSWSTTPNQYPPPSLTHGGCTSSA